MIKASYTFKTKALQNVLSGVSKLTSSRIKVGVVGPGASATHPTSHGDMPVWQIGALQEFGSRDGHIPERSFIRSTMAYTDWVRQTIGKAARQVVQGKSAHEALNWAGGVFANEIRHTFVRDIGPPNAKDTVDWKGHAHTLLGLSGALFDAIGHVITRGDR
jgi:hypothetical protein